jgi:DNA-binding transcriptional MocR family regulator
LPTLDGLLPRALLASFSLAPTIRPAPWRFGELAEACRQQGLWLISDEIYHGLEYEAPAETALANPNDAIVVNSFSKYFSMTGWCIGWLVVPETQALLRGSRGCDGRGRASHHGVAEDSIENEQDAHASFEA